MSENDVDNVQATLVAMEAYGNEHSKNSLFRNFTWWNNSKSIVRPRGDGCASSLADQNCSLRCLLCTPKHNTSTCVIQCFCHKCKGEIISYIIKVLARDAYWWCNKQHRVKLHMLLYFYQCFPIKLEVIPMLQCPWTPIHCCIPMLWATFKKKCAEMGIFLFFSSVLKSICIRAGSNCNFITHKLYPLYWS